LEIYPSPGGRQIIVALLLGVLMLLAQPAWAASSAAAAPSNPAEQASPSVLHFNVQADDLSLAPPPGYCPPQQAAEDKVRAIENILRQSGSGSRVLVALFPCAGSVAPSGSPTAIFIISGSTEKLLLDRQAFIKTQSNQWKSTSGQQELQQMLQNAISLSKQLKGGATLGEWKPTVADTDDNAVYMFSNVTSNAGGVARSGMLVTSMTLIKNYALGYVFVAPPGSPADAAALLALAKSQTKLFVDLNEPARN
jgi:hypothetical protein